MKSYRVISECIIGGERVKPAEVDTVSPPPEVAARLVKARCLEPVQTFEPAPAPVSDEAPAADAPKPRRKRRKK